DRSRRSCSGSTSYPASSVSYACSMDGALSSVSHMRVPEASRPKYCSVFRLRSTASPASSCTKTSPVRRTRAANEIVIRSFRKWPYHLSGSENSGDGTGRVGGVRGEPCRRAAAKPGPRSGAGEGLCHIPSTHHLRSTITLHIIPALYLRVKQKECE